MSEERERQRCRDQLTLILAKTAHLHDRRSAYPETAIHEVNRLAERTLERWEFMSLARLLKRVGFMLGVLADRGLITIHDIDSEL